MNQKDYHAEAARLLARAKEQKRPMSQRRDDAIMLAALLLLQSDQLLTNDERSIQEQLARMMKDPKGKAFTTSMTDQCFRSSDVYRIADQLVYLIDKFGIPRFLPFWHRLGIACFRAFGRWMPAILVPAVRRLLRRETSRVILPGEPAALAKHMQKRREEGVRVNLNHLGEAILGESEAESRLQRYLDDLANPDVEYISVKVSTIGSQLNLLSWEHTLQVLSERLRRLYRAAQTYHYQCVDGQRVPKFVNLDMEEYNDLRLTVELFCRVLDESEFEKLSAGIVLQAYIPDSFAFQQELTQWAMQRVAKGGAAIKIRIVKGANLAMERVIASVHGWPQAPYLTKAAVDANFKRMVIFGMVPEHARAVHLGIGSHNLFDLSFALILRSENGLEDQVVLEMLEGMADHLRRAVQAVAGGMLLYCPAASDAEFQNAIAYLIRRLDENTAPKNFLRHVFGLMPGTVDWDEQAALFAAACEDAGMDSSATQRYQNRMQTPLQRPVNSPFVNEPDTDWAQPANREWVEELVDEWTEKPLLEIPLVISSHALWLSREHRTSMDPSAPHQERYRYALATVSDIDGALLAADRVKQEWVTTTVHERSRILWQAAHAIRTRRRDLMGAMLFTCGKVAVEADNEIQEAIDFVEYYRREIVKLYELDDISWKARGTVVVAPPWNFPCSIPVGGIAAALAAGNCVIFKPAPEAVLVGYLVAQAFWDAGISRDVLQFIACDNEPTASNLIQDPRVAAVILTGATTTARHLLKLRPGLHLLAETGGKNAIIITSMADRDLAVRDAVQSAFGHAGQKCSACSLLICESEVYDDPHFRRQLSDAVSSLLVGPSWDLKTKVNPLIRPPGKALLRALTTLENGEEWLLCPEQCGTNPHLWSPGIKMGVKPGSFTHQTELFGPVLGVMRAEDLHEAIAIANGTPYGLTAGIHSLDAREQDLWAKRIQAGNLYINRGITGAVVQRQPFGGCKDSCFGPGAKAGGPNYLVNLMTACQRILPQESFPLEAPATDFCRWVEEQLRGDEALNLWRASVGSYAYYWKHVFAAPTDVSRVVGQDNLFTYRPQLSILRVHPNDLAFDVWRVCAAAIVCGAPLEISGDAPSLPSHPLLRSVKESEAQFALRMASLPYVRVRLLEDPSDSLKQQLAESESRVMVAPPLANGRLELLHYLREVSVSHDYHRYGNLGERENTP